MPRVSVILTSYNHEKYICEAIDSVLQQTFTDFELIIWDDASVDNSWQLISQYDDNRIKTFRNEVHTGPVFGINKAISEIVTGNYIAIHHSDDVWELNKLQQQVNFLDSHPEIGAVFSNAQAITENGSILSDDTHFYHRIFEQPNRTRYEWLRFFFNQGNALCHPSILIRKQCYQDCGLYNPILAQFPDFDMWIRLCLKYEIHVLPDYLIRFRVLNEEANTSGNRPDTRIRSSYEYYKVLSNFQKINYFDELVKVFPSAQKYDKGNLSSVNFALAMVALDKQDFSFTALFGLELLFSIISDEHQSEQIKQVYNFDYLDFISLTAKYDIFCQEELNRLNQVIVKYKKQLEIIHNSISWKITAPLRFLNRLF